MPKQRTMFEAPPKELPKSARQRGPDPVPSPTGEGLMDLLTSVFGIGEQVPGSLPSAAGAAAGMIGPGMSITKLLKTLSKRGMTNPEAIGMAAQDVVQHPVDDFINSLKMDSQGQGPRMKEPSRLKKPKN